MNDRTMTPEERAEALADYRRRREAQAPADLAPVGSDMPQWLAEIRDRVIALGRFAESVDIVTIQDERQGLFERAYMPGLPRLARAELCSDDAFTSGELADPMIRELLETCQAPLFPDGVWSWDTADIARIGPALRSVRAWRPGRRRLLCGLTGRGKTLALTYCGLRAISDPDWPVAVAYYSCRRLDAEKGKVPAELHAIPVLLLDEIHAIASSAEWHRNALFDLIDSRVNARLTTVAAGVMGPRELNDALGAEWVDRLGTGPEIVVIRDQRNWRTGNA